MWNKRRIFLFVFLFIAGCLFAIFDLLAANHFISFRQLILALFSPSSLPENLHLILFEFRIPKLITAILAGSALSVSGLLMQTVFRNPLAGPYVLGVSAGAGLGVALATMGIGSVFALSNFSVYSQIPVLISAWVGAALVLLLILLISGRIGNIVSVLIIGILFNSVITALINVLQYFAPESALKSYVIWTMGSLGAVTAGQIPFFAMITAIALIGAYFLATALNLLLLGETYARSSGLPVLKIRALIFFITSILTGSITAFCGPIGFVGLVVPHIARMLFGTSDHKILIPVSVLLGADIMIFSDILTYLPGDGLILPINTVTALTGIPVIIWIIFKDRNKA